MDDETSQDVDVKLSDHHIVIGGKSFGCILYYTCPICNKPIMAYWKIGPNDKKLTENEIGRALRDSGFNGYRHFESVGGQGFEYDFEKDPNKRHNHVKSSPYGYRYGGTGEYYVPFIKLNPVFQVKELFKNTFRGADTPIVSTMNEALSIMEKLETNEDAKRYFKFTYDKLKHGKQIMFFNQGQWNSDSIDDPERKFLSFGIQLNIIKPEAEKTKAEENPSMRAKFPGQCRKCGGRIEAGEPIVWTPEEGARHKKCPKKPEAVAPPREKTAIEKYRGFFISPHLSREERYRLDEIKGELLKAAKAELERDGYVQLDGELSLFKLSPNVYHLIFYQREDHEYKKYLDFIKAKTVKLTDSSESSNFFIHQRNIEEYKKLMEESRQLGEKLKVDAIEEARALKEAKKKKLAAWRDTPGLTHIVRRPERIIQIDDEEQGPMYNYEVLGTGTPLPEGVVVECRIIDAMAEYLLEPHTSETERTAYIRTLEEELKQIEKGIPALMLPPDDERDREKLEAQRKDTFERKRAIEKELIELKRGATSPAVPNPRSKPYCCSNCGYAYSAKFYEKHGGACLECGGELDECHHPPSVHADENPRTKERYFGDFNSNPPNPIIKVFYDDTEKVWYGLRIYQHQVVEKGIEAVQDTPYKLSSMMDRDISDNELRAEITRDFSRTDSYVHLKKLTLHDVEKILAIWLREKSQNDRQNALRSLMPIDPSTNKPPKINTSTNSYKSAESTGVWHRAMGRYGLAIKPSLPDEPESWEVYLYDAKPETPTSSELFPLSWNLTPRQAMEKWNKEDMGGAFSEDEVGKASANPFKTPNCPNCKTNQAVRATIAGTFVCDRCTKEFIFDKLSSPEINSDIGMIVYRSSDDFPSVEDEIDGTCWARNKETAEAYMDNPPYGGSRLFTAKLKGTILDFINPERGIKNKLLKIFARSKIKRMDEDEIEEAIQYPLELIEGNTGRKYPYGLWEECQKVREYLQSEGYSAIMYMDDFPEGAVVYHVLENDAIIDVKEIDKNKMDKNPASSEEIEKAKKEVHKFTAFEAKNVSTIHLTALTKKLKRLCDWGTILYNSDKWTKESKNYFHPWGDKAPRSVYIAEDESHILGVGTAVVKPDGLNDHPFWKGGKEVSLEDIRKIRVWAKLANFLSCDLPCKACGTTLHYDEESGWTCDKCKGPAEPKYQIAPGQVLYHGPSKTILCIGKIKA